MVTATEKARARTRGGSARGDVSGACLVASLVSVGVITGRDGDTASWLSNGANFGNYVYEKPWSRIGPYLIGIATAFLAHRFGRHAVGRIPGPLRAAMALVAGCRVVSPKRRVPRSARSTTHFGK